MEDNIFDEVISIMKEASSQKIMIRGTEKSKELFKKAYKLCEDSNIDNYLKKICAYRLGHLILRNPKSDEDLYDAEEYFLEAARGNTLGLLPRIYRIAVLYRLKQDKEVIEDEIVNITDEIRKLREKGLEYNRSASSDSIFLQNMYFNMLELSTYFTNANYNALEGIGAYDNYKDDDFYPVYKDIFPYPGDWKIIGTEKFYNRLTGYFLPEKIAIDEVYHIVGKSSEPVVAFIFPYSQYGKVIVKKTGKAKYIEENVNWGDAIKRLFIVMLEERTDKIAEISLEVFNKPNTDQVKQYRKRLKDYLKNYIESVPKWNGLDIYIQDSSSGSGKKINPKLNILLAYSRNIIDMVTRES